MENKIRDILEIHNENFSEKKTIEYFREILKKNKENNNNYEVFVINEENMVINIKEIINKNLNLNYKIIGYIIFYDTTENIDLFEIAIKKEFQNKKIAYNLFVECENIFLREKLEKRNSSIILEVRESNEKAIKLYKKLNFLEISTRKNYYGNESALIMEKKY